MPFEFETCGAHGTRRWQLCVAGLAIPKVWPQAQAVLSSTSIHLRGRTRNLLSKLTLSTSISLQPSTAYAQTPPAGHVITPLSMLPRHILYDSDSSGTHPATCARQAVFTPHRPAALGPRLTPFIWLQQRLPNAGRWKTPPQNMCNCRLTPLNGPNDVSTQGSVPKWPPVVPFDVIALYIEASNMSVAVAI